MKITMSQLKTIIREEIVKELSGGTVGEIDFPRYAGGYVVSKAYSLLKPFKGWEDGMSGSDDGIENIQWSLPDDEDWWDNFIGVGIDPTTDGKNVKFGLSVTKDGKYAYSTEKKVKLTGDVNKDAKLFVAWIKQLFPKVAKKYFNK